MIPISDKHISEFNALLAACVPHSAARYWDGEMSVMVGREGMNVDGVPYEKELGEELWKTIEHNYQYFHMLNAPETHLGTVRLRNEFERMLVEKNSRVQWYDAMVWQRLIQDGHFSFTFKILSERKNILFVAGEHLRSGTQQLLPQSYFVPVERTRAFTRWRETADEVKRWAEANDEAPVAIFCAGMTSNVLIDNLWPTLGAHVTMLDMGTVWDALCGLRTRQWIRRIPIEDIRRNYDRIATMGRAA